MRDVAMWHLSGAARDTGGRRPPPPAGGHLLAWGLIVLTTLLGPPAASQSKATDLLAGLYLTGYTPGTKPPGFAGGTIEGQEVSHSLKLPYPLLSDVPDLKAIRNYGVLHPSGIFAGRAFFLIDQEGIVRGKWSGEPYDVFPTEPILKATSSLRRDEGMADMALGGRGDMGEVRVRVMLTNAVDQALVRREL